MTIKKRIKNFAISIYEIYISRFLFYLNPRISPNIIFRHVFKRNINWSNPRNLQEKTLWLLFNKDTSLWTFCADKYKVREYVTTCGCEDSLVKLYGMWTNINQINFESLPERFILKSNNGCGTNLVVKNKDELNYDKTIKILNSWLKKPYGYNGSQLHYLKIEPCIIAEELLEQSDINSVALVDYKVWCFNGKAECIIVIFNRTKDKYSQIVYNLKWENISSKVYKNESCYSKSDIPKPKSFLKMIEYAERLSKKFPQVRVDFYDIKGKLYFGEMTFTAGYGDLSEEYYEYLGDKIKIGDV
jgi:hypothetical protein